MCTGDPNTCGYTEVCPSDRETPMCGLTGGCCSGRAYLPVTPPQTTLAYAARELLTALEECSCRQDDIWEALMHTRQGDVVSQTMVQLEDELTKGETR